MKLEDQVCDLEYAKKLRELGVEKESLFYWYKLNDDIDWQLVMHDKLYQIVKSNNVIPAYTVAELGALLPDCLYAHSASGIDRPIIMNKVDGIFSVGILNSNRQCNPIFADKKEANARVLMLIYLIENGLVKVEDLK